MNESSLNASVGLKLRTLRLQRHVKQADAARDLGRVPGVPEPHREGEAGDALPAPVEGAPLLRPGPRAVHGLAGPGPGGRDAGQAPRRAAAQVAGDRPRGPPAPLGRAEAGRHRGGAVQPLQEHPDPAGEAHRPAEQRNRARRRGHATGPRSRSTTRPSTRSRTSSRPSATGSPSSRRRPSGSAATSRWTGR